VRPPFPSAGLLRAQVGRTVRRLGLVPGGDPDGVGEDDRVGDLVLHQRVAVFFPEPPRNAYQLEQWLQPLEALDREHGVVVITQDSRTTARLRSRTGLTVLCVARTATLDRLVSRGALALALYVSHHPRNFSMLRFGSLAHVYLGHGDSDKAVSASNQLKAYDRVFVAGQAGIDRVVDELLWFDPDRLVCIGRPQLSASAMGAGRPPATPATVLYAPTWEGAQASMAYSSVASHGEALVRSLLAAGHRVVYRPHPRTGANSRQVRDADARLRAVFDETPARASGSEVAADLPLARAFAAADLLITDVSSLAVEWLPTRRPLVVTESATAEAGSVTSPLLAAVPRLSADDAGTAGSLVRRCLETDDEAPARAALEHYYLGDVEDGVALQCFLRECENILAARAAAIGEPVLP
jgi:CDP-Glycerol:Poly(glycerophosphate) glycerophosphotransferase